MEKRKSIEEKVEQTVNSIDGLQRAAAAPFFFTRVMARIQREESGAWERAASFITRPAIVIGTLALILLLNAAVFYLPSQKSNTAVEQAEPGFTDDYIAANNSFFEFENGDAGQ